MPWPSVNVAADGSLIPFATNQIQQLGMDGITAQTADVARGEHPTFRLDANGCSIIRQWYPPWERRDDALAYMLGYAALAGTFPNWTLSRVMPQSFGNRGYEQYVALSCDPVTGARSAGKNEANGIPAYKSARIVTRYELVFFGLAPDNTVPEYNRYVEQLPSTTDTSYLSLPGSGMFYRTSTTVGPSGVLIPYNVGRPEILKRVSYKWWRVPYEAWLAGSPLFKRVYGDPTNLTQVPAYPGAPAYATKMVGAPYIGCVSSAAMLGYPSGYALFEGVEEEIVSDPVRGFPCWNLTFKFLIKSVQGGNSALTEAFGGHNYLFYNSLASAGGSGSGALSGYYFATKFATYINNGSIWDGICMYNERNLLNLWNVGAVPDANI